MQIDVKSKAAGRQDAHFIGVYQDKVAAWAQKEFHARGAKATLGQILIFPSSKKKAKTLCVVGLGKEQDLTHEKLRTLAAQIANKCRAEKWLEISLDYAGFALKEKNTDSARALAEGFLLSAYSFNRYKTDPKKETLRKLELVDIAASRLASVRASVSEAKTICEGVAIAKDLANEPPNVLYPASYAERIRKIAKSVKLTCTVFDEKQIKREKMGGLYGVGMGSVNKPRLVILNYRPSRVKNKRPIVLVGKGVTFDTGGISIKPSKDMDQMKFDMCGSAAVIGAIYNVAKLKLPLHVMAITPLAENMPGGNAQRPGDVVRCCNGKTVEVMNTDAEGRLILADALAYAKRYKPLCLLDAATLTGLAAYFYDSVASCFMGTDPKLNQRLFRAGEKTGERVWEAPLYEEYGEMVKAPTADIQNVSKRTAGTITAAMFLKHFADHSPWIHLDIAGTAWGSDKPYQASGATGVGVRLFTEFLKSYL